MIVLGVTFRQRSGAFTTPRLLDSIRQSTVHECHLVGGRHHDVGEGSVVLRMDQLVKNKSKVVDVTFKTSGFALTSLRSLVLLSDPELIRDSVFA